MSESVRIAGSGTSAAAVRLLALCRYKGIEHIWTDEGSALPEDLSEPSSHRRAPGAIWTNGAALGSHDDAFDTLEREFAEPGMHSGAELVDFVSGLLAEYGGSWVTKLVLQQRWGSDPDREVAAQRVAEGRHPGADQEVLAKDAAEIAQSMARRFEPAGFDSAARDFVTASWRRSVAILDTHLVARRYLLGDRPSLADFGLFPAFHQGALDVTAFEVLEASGKNVLAWIDRMLEPRIEGAFDRWEILEPTLGVLLEEELAGAFFPWADAHARALAAGEKEVRVDFGACALSEPVEPSASRSLNRLRAAYWGVEDAFGLDAVLDASRCYDWIVPAS